MNICLPYTYLIGDLFRCLFTDLSIDFTSAPKPGKYTLQIGQSFSGGTLCPGLQRVLGSIAECRYLGSDTALIFAPCGGCSAERIKRKLENCLEENGLGIKIIAFEPSRFSQKSFWKELREKSPVSLFEFKSAKMRFFECVRLLERFLKIKRQLVSNPVSDAYLKKTMKDILSARTLFDLKLLLSLYTKRLGSLERKNEAVSLEKNALPYLDGDYFNVEKTGFFEGDFFNSTKKEENFNDEISVPKCPVNGDISVFLGV